MDNGYFEHKDMNKIIEVVQNTNIPHLDCEFLFSSTYMQQKKKKKLKVMAVSYNMLTDKQASQE